MKGKGEDDLWLWFGLSRATFCVMPIVRSCAPPHLRACLHRRAPVLTHPWPTPTTDRAVCDIRLP